MKYLITMIVEGDKVLKHDLEVGHVEAGIQCDVFFEEKILSFLYRELTDEEFNATII